MIQYSSIRTHSNRPHHERSWRLLPITVLALFLMTASLRAQVPDPDTEFDELRHRSDTSTPARAPVALSTSSGTSSVQAGFRQQGGATGSSRPWSGIWWPLKKGGLAFDNYSDGLSPMEKYDTIYYNVTGRVAGAASWEADPANGHNKAPLSNASSWAGHCKGLAAASILEKEPRSNLRFQFGSRASKIALKWSSASTAPHGFSKDGRPDYYQYSLPSGSMLLTVADQKGWLSEIYHGANILSLGNVSYSGQRYNNTDVRPNDLAYKDILPHYFHYLLLRYVKSGQPIVVDTSTGYEVFNYPLYAYDSRSTYYPAQRIHAVRTTVSLTDFAKEANYVGTLVKTKDYTYNLRVDSAGRIISSEWTGSSVNDHPDFAWIPVGLKSPSQWHWTNVNLDHGRIRGWLQNSQSAQAQYRFD